MVEAQTPWFGDGLCTSGDHERGLVAPLCHCLSPRGGVVLCLSNPNGSKRKPEPELTKVQVPGS